MARARAWHLVYVCVKQESVRGENSAGHKGCRKVQEWEGGEGRNEGTLELEVGWWVGGGGGGGGEGRGGLQITHCTLLNSAGPHTHIKVVPLYARGLVSPCPPPHVTPYILLFMLNN